MHRQKTALGCGLLFPVGVPTDVDPGAAGAAGACRERAGAARTAPRASRPGRIGPGLWALFGATFFSMVMTIGQITILGKQVFDMTGRPLYLGLLGLAEFVPDLPARADHRHWSRTDSSAVSCSHGASAARPLPRSACSSTSRRTRRRCSPYTAWSSRFGTARAFQMAVSRALPVDLAPEGARERTVALNVAGWQAGFIVGPVTFGFAFEVDPALPYLLAACCSAAAIALLMLVPSGDVQRAGVAAGAGVTGRVRARPRGPALRPKQPGGARSDLS